MKNIILFISLLRIILHVRLYQYLVVYYLFYIYGVKENINPTFVITVKMQG